MTGKRILIVDEPRFARVCQALLLENGFVAAFLPAEEARAEGCEPSDYDLVIASYPFGAELAGRLKGRKVPLIVLADCLNRDVLESVRSLENSCCLIKPLDFERFYSVVRRMLGEGENLTWQSES